MEFNGGKLGELFAALSFSASLVASFSFFLAERRNNSEKKGWEKIGKSAFLIHSLSVVGVFSSLFYLIASHQYQFHYVWAHSSNELPIYYMISCFWEGQEGSFLLWTFWHAVLGCILLFNKTEWRNPVMAVIASVQAILSSMILGVFLSKTETQWVFLLAVFGPSLWLLFNSGKENNLLGRKGLPATVSIIISLVIAGMTFNDFHGFWAVLKTGQFVGLENFLGWLLAFAFLLSIVWLFVLLFQAAFSKQQTYSGISILILAWSIVLFGITLQTGLAPWKIGSSPFTLLKDALPNAPVFILNPEFVPLNGNGLNPLLQNYWMVIHPPTLFLGFASTLIPFAYAISGLLRKDVTGWIRPSSPWLVFSVMILGVGIIMGGYWAYETLSFGGYWNWDPVENASFVPWLTGIASLHGLLAWRKSKSFLGFSMALVLSTFLLVLYSTFLTRSGILGEASVHTFTDLGLSGQLLLLLGAYCLAVFVLFVFRLKDLTGPNKDIPFISKEFFLFLGTLTIIFAALGICLATSLPVINKLLGTHLAPPPDVPFFYFKWNVWFAILIGILSGIGQFLYWRRIEKKDMLKSLFRPFLLAIISSSIILILLALNRWTFAYENQYRDWLELAGLSENFINKASYYIQFFVVGFADEFLLTSALFMAFSAIDVAYHLLKSGGAKRIRILGGTFAHTGFGLMLMGFVFSSGYSSIVSKNMNPTELTLFDENERTDNVLLVKNKPRFINGYQVTYKGKKQAIIPLRRFEILEKNNSSFKFSFLDSLGEKFSHELPLTHFFTLASEATQFLDTFFLQQYMEERLSYLQPKLINSRSLYGVEFVPLLNSTENLDLDSSKIFTLWPEAEINKGMGLIAHPSRKMYLNRDLYIHVSSIPKEDEERKFKNQFLDLSIGQTDSIPGGKIQLISLTNEDATDLYELIVRADFKIIKEDQELTAQVKFRVSRKNEVHPGVTWLEGPRCIVSFLGIDPDREKMQFSVQVEENPKEDFIVLKAIHKPWIGLVWLGTFVLVIGFILSIMRRRSEI